jgi:opacity protein-like surface antigen
MNKKWSSLLVVSSCFLMSTAAFSAQSLPFNGAYAGAAFGQSLAYANQTIVSHVDLEYPGFTFASNQPFSLYSSMVRSSATGAIFAGVGHTWDKFYLSGEMVLSNANYKTSSSSVSGIERTVDNYATISGLETVTSTASVSPTQFGVFLRPGVLLTPTSLLYGRVGTSVVNVNYNTKTAALKSLSQSGTTLAFPITMQANKRVTRAAFQIGTGFEQAINERLTVRLDYLYAYYGTIKMYSSQTASIDPFVLSARGTQSVSLNDQSIMLGLVYHFIV